MKAGTRLKSAVCDSEVVIIRCNVEQVDCGGQPMAEAPEKSDAGPDEAFASGAIMGKRYVTEDGGTELLCVKPGKGSLSIAGTALRLKEAKPLPASD